MTVQYSDAVRNAVLDAFETTIGTSAILKIRSGTVPANCAAADTGDVLVTVTMPADWMSAAASGSKAKLGTWEDEVADATGVPGHFRIYASDGTTCHMQGTVTTAGGGGDAIASQSPIVAGFPVLITNFTLTAGGA